MQSLHRALMGMTLIAVLALALGSAGAWSHSAIAQHGQAHGESPADNAVADHFHMILEQLQLTAEQRETLAEPLGEAYAAMLELHRIHGVIAAELTEEQRARLDEIGHGLMEGMSHGAGDSGHGAGHDGGHH